VAAVLAALAVRVAPIVQELLLREYLAAMVKEG